MTVMELYFPLRYVLRYQRIATGYALPNPSTTIVVDVCYVDDKISN